MKKYLLGLILGLVYTGAALAGSVSATGGSDVVTLYERACPAKIVDLAAKNKVPEPILATMQAANAIVSGQPFQACWFEYHDIVVVVYEDGDMGMISKGAFKAVKET